MEAAAPVPPPSERTPRRRRIRRLVRRLSRGLKRMLGPEAGALELHLEESGIRFPEASEAPLQVGPYLILGDKTKGVEPGFVATRAWSERDTAKLVDDPSHRFYHWSSRLLRERLAQEIEAGEGALLERALAVLAEHGEEAPTAELAARQLDHRHERHALLRALKQDEAVQAELRAELMRTDEKFTKKHYVKMDYVEADRRLSLLGFGGEVRIPADKQKFFLHREFTAQTREAANRRAVREVIANELMRVFGIHTQELTLVPSQYEDGYPKLLLDATQLVGPGGEPFEDFEGHLDDGYLVARDEAGELRPDRSVRELGRVKVLLLALADWDALGWDGGNKGRVGNLFAGIDPGHALEMHLLERRGDVHSDLSFDQPSLLPRRGYKNFTLFDQDSFSEQMEGARKLKELAANGRDLAVFDAYAASFDGTADSRLDFSPEILAMRDAYRGRRDDILGVLAERLAIDDFRFGHDGAREKQIDRANRLLDFLDGVEKLTSRTSNLSPRGRVRLWRPRVFLRREWHIMQNERDEVVLSFKGSSRQASEASTVLGGFIEASPRLRRARDEGRLRMEDEAGAINLVLSARPDLGETVDTVSEAFAVEAILAFKEPAS